MPRLEELPKKNPHVLAQRAADDYLSSIASLPTHPLFAELPTLRSQNFELFALFLQNLGELVAFSIDSPHFFGREGPAAQSARHTLSRHPSWMRCASDLATQARLSDKAFSALASWIE